MLKRKSQFTALVDIDGEELTAHIPTTNRIGDVENKNLPCLLSYDGDREEAKLCSKERLFYRDFLSSEKLYLKETENTPTSASGGMNPYRTEGMIENAEKEHVYGRHHGETMVE